MKIWAKDENGKLVFDALEIETLEQARRLARDWNITNALCRADREINLVQYMCDSVDGKTVGGSICIYTTKHLMSQTSVSVMRKWRHS